jgi:hypothetical protein
MASRFARSAAAVLGLFVTLGLAAVAISPATAWAAAPQSKTVPTKAASASPSAGRILLAWGVGGVLTDDGTLWQYRPDQAKWVTIDESFRQDGEQRRVLPLPVAAHDVQFMQGFGFLVTRSGTAWLYDLDQNKWRSLGSPGR